MLQLGDRHYRRASWGSWRFMTRISALSTQYQRAISTIYRGPVQYCTVLKRRKAAFNPRIPV